MEIVDAVVAGMDHHPAPLLDAGPVLVHWNANNASSRPPAGEGDDAGAAFLISQLHQEQDTVVPGAPAAPVVGTTATSPPEAPTAPPRPVEILPVSKTPTTSRLALLKRKHPQLRKVQPQQASDAEHNLPAQRATWAPGSGMVARGEQAGGETSLLQPDPAGAEEAVLSLPESQQTLKNVKPGELASVAAGPASTTSTPVGEISGTSCDPTPGKITATSISNKENNKPSLARIQNALNHQQFHTRARSVSCGGGGGASSGHYRHVKSRVDSGMTGGAVGGTAAAAPGAGGAHGQLHAVQQQPPPPQRSGSSSSSSSSSSGAAAVGRNSGATGATAGGRSSDVRSRSKTPRTSRNTAAGDAPATTMPARSRMTGANAKQAEPSVQETRGMSKDKKEMIAANLRDVKAKVRSRSSKTAAAAPGRPSNNSSSVASSPTEIVPPGGESEGRVVSQQRGSLVRPSVPVSEKQQAGAAAAAANKVDAEGPQAACSASQAPIKNPWARKTRPLNARDFQNKPGTAAGVLSNEEDYFEEVDPSLVLEDRMGTSKGTARPSVEDEKTGSLLTMNYVADGGTLRNGGELDNNDLEELVSCTVSGSTPIHLQRTSSLRNKAFGGGSTKGNNIKPSTAAVGVGPPPGGTLFDPEDVHQDETEAPTSSSALASSSSSSADEGQATGAAARGKTQAQQEGEETRRAEKLLPHSGDAVALDFVGDPSPEDTATTDERVPASGAPAPLQQLTIKNSSIVTTAGGPRISGDTGRRISGDTGSVQLGSPITNAGGGGAENQTLLPPFAASGSTIAAIPMGTNTTIGAPVEPPLEPSSEHLPTPAADFATANHPNLLAMPANPDDEQFQIDPNTGLLIPTREETRIACPHCNRNFNKEAAARHIPRCADIKHRPAARSLQKKKYIVDKLGRRIEVKEKPGAVGGGSGGGPAAGGGAEEGEGAGVAARTAKGKGKGKSAARNKQETSVSTAEAADPPATSSLIPPALDSQWGQVQILLTEGINAVNSKDRIDSTLQQAEQGLDWVQNVEKIAKQSGIMKGKLSRMLLPFNKDTDAKNQANVKSDLGSPELDALNIPMEQRKQMVRQALAVRKFLRVKVADDADMDLLKDSLSLILAFFQNLDRLMLSLKDKSVIEPNMQRDEFILKKMGVPFAHKFREGPPAGGKSIFENDRDYFKY
ncbi:unnamed protein product [Amoebophrya sp. A120]|nr:unnamed protein product [Amoebophrya sp. A120]|eukprot:GSA120T00023702001.1